MGYVQTKWRKNEEKKREKERQQHECAPRTWKAFKPNHNFINWKNRNECYGKFNKDNQCTYLRATKINFERKSPEMEQRKKNGRRAQHNTECNSNAGEKDAVETVAHVQKLAYLRHKLNSRIESWTNTAQTTANRNETEETKKWHQNEQHWSWNQQTNTKRNNVTLHICVKRRENV